MKIPALEAGEAAGGTLHAEALPPLLAFSTDTRTIEAGQVFVALRGASYDGHRFTAEARARGAAALVVDDPAAVPEGIAALVVADTTAAYLAFAGAARRRLGARVVAITGSTGKTTTKAFTAQLLERARSGPVAATAANENNEIGVAKLFLGLAPDVAYVVVEFGARHYGEIAPLARVARPHVAVLTNVGDAAASPTLVRTATCGRATRARGDLAVMPRGELHDDVGNVRGEAEEQLGDADLVVLVGRRRGDRATSGTFQELRREGLGGRLPGLPVIATTRAPRRRRAAPAKRDKRPGRRRRGRGRPRGRRRGRRRPARPRPWRAPPR